MTAASWPTLGIPPAAVPAWRRLAASLEDREPPCSTVPALWFSRRPDETEAARHRCHGCHAFGPCAEYADAANEATGVWGGRDRNPGSTARRGVGVSESLQEKKTNNSPHCGPHIHRGLHPGGSP